MISKSKKCAKKCTNRFQVLQQVIQTLYLSDFKVKRFQNFMICLQFYDIFFYSSHDRHSELSLYLLLVTTPSRKITLGSSNCPMMLASVRKSSLFLSVAPALRVLIATDISGLAGTRSLPLHTSPNSPKEINNFMKY